LGVASVAVDGNKIYAGKDNLDGATLEVSSDNDQTWKSLLKLGEGEIIKDILLVK
jgi:hypothetical protein